MRRQLAFLLMYSVWATPVWAEVLKDMTITGTRRIEDSTVVSYLHLEKGQNITTADLDQATKTLFATGLFSDVDIQMNKGIAQIRVVENPIVRTVYFEGNKALSNDILNTEVLLKPRMVYTKRKLQNDAARLVDRSL